MVSMQPQAITKVSISALVISLPIIYVSLLRVPPSTLARDSTFWFLMSNSIIAIIAADSGVLFLGSASHHDDGDHSEVVPGEEPVATAHDDYYRDAMSVPLMASADEPTALVDTSVAMVGDGEQLLSGGLVSCKAAESTDGMDQGHVQALIESEGAASKPSTDRVDHSSVLQRCEGEEETPDLQPINASKNDAMIVKGDQCTIPSDLRITVTPEAHVPQDEGCAGEREEVKPRWCSVTEESKPQMKPRWCSVTDQSKPRLAKEREYWQLSDEELNRKVEEFITRFNQDMIEQEAAAV